MSARAEPATRWQSDRVFNIGMALAIFATAFVAVATAFVKADLGIRVLSPRVQTHAVAFVGWLLLFFTQTVLVASHRLDVHRRLGIAGAVVVSVMMSLTVLAAVESFRTSGASFGLISFVVFAVPHVDMIIFAPLVVAGLIFRRRPETHKRLMLLATISLLGETTSRLPMLWRLGPQAHFLVQDLFVLAAIAYDLASRGRVHPVYVWGGLAILILPPLAGPTWSFLRALQEVQ